MNTWILLSWICAQLMLNSYQCPTELPKIVKVNQEFMHIIALQQFSGYAIYYNNTIFILDNIDNNTILYNIVIVHELVHHVQWWLISRPPRMDCELVEHEHQAYQIQIQFMKDLGLTNFEDFGILDWTFRYAMCQMGGDW